MYNKVITDVVYGYTINNKYLYTNKAFSKVAFKLCLFFNKYTDIQEIVFFLNF